MTCRMRLATEGEALAVLILDENKRPLMAISLQDHNVNSDKFVIRGQRLFKVIKANPEVLEFEDSMGSAIERWNSIFENVVLFENGKFFVEVSDTLILTVSNITEMVSGIKNLRNRYVCFCNEQSKILLLKDTHLELSEEFEKVA